jgi:hypothetical protein
MKVSMIVLGSVLFAGFAAAQTSGNDKAVSIGPWQIESSFTDQRKFDRCSMSRTTQEGIEARFARDQGGLSLALSSPRWQLDKGKNYPVEFVAGKASWKIDVTASDDSVSVVLNDAKFNEALKTANNLEVRGAGSTFRFPLDKSSQALTRLQTCFEAHSKALETNPFVAPKP